MSLLLCYSTVLYYNKPCVRNSGAACLFVEKPTVSFVNEAEVTHNLFLAGSDMELDLLAAAETESDSESNHSNQDNASGRRSVVTAATAGSEAGASI